MGPSRRSLPTTMLSGAWFLVGLAPTRFLGVFTSGLNSTRTKSKEMKEAPEMGPLYCSKKWILKIIGQLDVDIYLKYPGINIYIILWKYPLRLIMDLFLSLPGPETIILDFIQYTMMAGIGLFIFWIFIFQRVDTTELSVSRSINQKMAMGIA